MSKIFDVTNIKVNAEDANPIYLQIAQQIIDLIEADQTDLSAATIQLPSVRALADSLDVARGTIQQSYNYLENNGYIYRITGKGSFIKPQETTDVSRKDQALSALDNMLETFENLGFSDREIQIYFDLKMREREKSEENLKIGIVAESSEIRTILQNYLTGISNLETYRYPIDELAYSGDVLLDNLDAILTTTDNYQRISTLLNSYHVSIDILILGLNLTPQTVLEMASVRAKKQIGILTHTMSFADLMKEQIVALVQPEKEPLICLLNDDQIDTFLDKVNYIFLPSNLLYVSSQQIISRLKNYQRNKGKIIDFQLTAENGSLHYLLEKIDDKKRTLKRMQMNGGIHQI